MTEETTHINSMIPLDDISESDSIPAGGYELEVMQLVKGETGTGKKMFTPQYRVVKGDYEGQYVFPGPFVVGTEADPMALDPQTWTRGNFAAKQFKRLCKAVGITGSKSDDQICAEIIGRRFNALVTEEVDTNPQSPFKGEKRNKIAPNGYHLIGQAPTIGVSGGAPMPQSRPPIPMPGGRNNHREQVVISQKDMAHGETTSNDDGERQ